MTKYRWKGISKYNPKELFTNSIAISTGGTVINIDTIRKGVDFLLKNNDFNKGDKLWKFT